MLSSLKSLQLALKWLITNFTYNSPTPPPNVNPQLNHSKLTSNSQNCHPSYETSTIKLELCQIQQSNFLTQWQQSNGSQFGPPLQTDSPNSPKQFNTFTSKIAPKNYFLHQISTIHTQTEPNSRIKFLHRQPDVNTSKNQRYTKFTSNWSPSPQKSPKVAIFHIITQQFTQKRSQTRPFNSYPNVGYQQELNQSPISTKNSSKSPEKHKKKTSKYYLQVNAITSSSKNNQKTIKKSPKIQKKPTHN